MANQAKYQPGDTVEIAPGAEEYHPQALGGQMVVWETYQQDSGDWLYWLLGPYCSYANAVDENEMVSV